MKMLVAMAFPSHAECDAANGVCWDLGVCFLPADPEHHRGVGGDGGGGVQGFAQPALRPTLVHFNGDLQREIKHQIHIIEVTK